MQRSAVTHCPESVRYFPGGQKQPSSHILSPLQPASAPDRVRHVRSHILPQASYTWPPEHSISGKIKSKGGQRAVLSSALINQPVIMMTAGFNNIQRHFLMFTFLRFCQHHYQHRNLDSHLQSTYVLGAPYPSIYLCVKLKAERKHLPPSMHVHEKTIGRKQAARGSITDNRGDVD